MSLRTTAVALVLALIASACSGGDAGGPDDSLEGTTYSAGRGALVVPEGSTAEGISISEVGTEDASQGLLRLVGPIVRVEADVEGDARIALDIENGSTSEPVLLVHRETPQDPWLPVPGARRVANQLIADISGFSDFAEATFDVDEVVQDVADNAAIHWAFENVGDIRADIPSCTEEGDARESEFTLRYEGPTTDGADAQLLACITRRAGADDGTHRLEIANNRGVSVEAVVPSEWRIRQQPESDWSVVAAMAIADLVEPMTGPQDTLIIGPGDISVFTIPADLPTPSQITFRYSGATAAIDIALKVADAALGFDLLAAGRLVWDSLGTAVGCMSGVVSGVVQGGFFDALGACADETGDLLGDAVGLVFAKVGAFLDAAGYAYSFVEVAARGELFAGAGTITIRRTGASDSGTPSTDANAAGPVDTSFHREPIAYGTGEGVGLLADVAGDPSDRTIAATRSVALNRLSRAGIIDAEVVWWRDQLVIWAPRSTDADSLRRLLERQTHINLRPTCLLAVGDREGSPSRYINAGTGAAGCAAIAIDPGAVIEGGFTELADVTPDDGAKLTDLDGVSIYIVGPALLDSSAIDTVEAVEGGLAVRFGEGEGLDLLNFAAQLCFSRTNECPTGQLAWESDGQILTAPAVQSWPLASELTISGASMAPGLAGVISDRIHAAAISIAQAELFATPDADCAALEESGALIWRDLCEDGWAVVQDPEPPGHLTIARLGAGQTWEAHVTFPAGGYCRQFAERDGVPPSLIEGVNWEFPCAAPSECTSAVMEQFRSLPNTLHITCIQGWNVALWASASALAVEVVDDSGAYIGGTNLASPWDELGPWLLGLGAPIAAVDAAVAFFENG